jgi:murein DD-endopeptidase MepM/ murein hydrolase activator NlpD
MRTGRRAGVSRLSRLGRLLLAATFIAIVTGAVAAPVSAGDPLADAIAKQKALHAKITAQKAQIAKLKAQQTVLQAKIDTTATQLAGVNADLKAARKEVAGTSADVTAARKRVESIADTVHQWDATVADLDAEVAKEDRLLEIRKSLLATRIRAAYMTDRTSLLETVLSAQSFTDVISDVSSYLDFSAQDQALAKQIEQDRQQLAITRQMSADARATANELRLEARDQKDALLYQLATLKRAKTQLKKLDAKVKAQLAIQQRNFSKVRLTASQLRTAMNKEIAAENALKNKIQQLINAQQLGGNIPSQYNGSLIWPLGGVVTQEYGCTGVAWEPPMGNCSHFHNGIDIAAGMGSPIRASGDGVVAFAGYNPYDPDPKAVIVIIAHSTSLQTWYGHLEPNLPVRAGQRVSQGQVIGYVGMTGRTSGPHLHWMVDLNNSFVNPRLFL